MKNECKEHLQRTSRTALLTVVVGDGVWDVDVAVGPLSPQAAAGRAGVGVPLGLAVDGDVSLHHHGLVKVGGCNGGQDRTCRLRRPTSRTVTL